MIHKSNVIRFPVKKVSLLSDKPRGMAVMTGFIAAMDGLPINAVLEIVSGEINVDQVREGFQLWINNPNLTVAEVFSGE